MTRKNEWSELAQCKISDKNIGWVQMLGSRPQLQKWVDENVTNGNLFKSGASKELDALDAYEVSQLFETEGPS